jgi:hypothetical protein
MRCGRAVFVTAILCLLAFCTVPISVRTLSPNAGALDPKAKYLKAHLRNGDVYLLSDWTTDSADKVLSGTGNHFNSNRESIEQGNLSLPIDSVALFETNVISKSLRLRSLATMTGISAAVTAICLTNTKACFGSCPTFYVSDGDKSILQAEGFSASVLPSLEATDVDALYRAQPSSRDFAVRMKNEALETHVVRSLRLLCAPRSPGGRVFATANREFWRSGLILPPSRCSAPEGDCTRQLRALDGEERSSLADRHDLSRHETIDLEFEDPGDVPLGVVLAARQTLLSTFLLYQTYAYLGTRATEALATFERDSSRSAQVEGIAGLLGGIDVLMQDGRRWKNVGSFHETGPLATDVQLIPIPRGSGSHQRVRLRLAKGLWRIDSVALARLDERVVPQVMAPVDGPTFGRPLVTTPGDSYTFAFRLPEDFADQELFLESRGYYLEWMRDEWMRDESRIRAAMMFFTPHLALRVLAPQFKKIEPQMERLFWNSRYAVQ